MKLNHETDRLQKTWIPEGTEEYKIFKLKTDENRYLGQLLCERFSLGKGDLVLDVGGREADIALELTGPECIHLVDPDPTLALDVPFARYWKQRVQDVDDLGAAYDLIICSHVLGYLGTQSVQAEVFRQLVEALKPGGTLVLFYNTNSEYMGDLLAFSKTLEIDGHYDYFDESLLQELDPSTYDIGHQDVMFELSYDSWEDLARCCWFLFGAMDQDIEGVAKLFLPRLREDLAEPSFPIAERVTFVTRKR